MFSLGWGAKVDTAMEKVKRDELAKETSAESFAQAVEQQLLSKAHSVEKFAGYIKARPGLNPRNITKSWSLPKPKNVQKTKKLARKRPMRKR